MSRFIHKTPRQQPSGEPRDISELSKKVELLSRELADRPQMSSAFIETTQDDRGQTVDLIANDGTNQQINSVVHGLGRTYRGWYLVGIDAAANVWNASTAEIRDNNIDTTVYLPLKCSNDCTIKLVVF